MIAINYFYFLWFCITDTDWDFCETINVNSGTIDLTKTRLSVALSLSNGLLTHWVVLLQVLQVAGVNTRVVFQQLCVVYKRLIIPTPPVVYQYDGQSWRVYTTACCHWQNSQASPSVKSEPWGRTSQKSRFEKHKQTSAPADLVEVLPPVKKIPVADDGDSASAAALEIDSASVLSLKVGGKHWDKVEVDDLSHLPQYPDICQGLSWLDCKTHLWYEWINHIALLETQK